MPVTNKHSLYLKSERAWQEVRDCVEGNSAIKSRKVEYLPMLSGQTVEDYERYQQKVKFFGATGRALDGLHGNIFRKGSEQSSEISDTFIESLNDVDLMGTTVDQFVSDLIYDSLQTNWGGVLVDYARGEEANSLADAENKGFKAYLKYYKAENVINWEYKIIHGKLQLNWIVLVEPYSAAVENDRFTFNTYFKYRVLYIDEVGYYAQDVYDSQYALEYISEHYEPKMQGARLFEIPFFTIPGKEPEKSMLYDLAQLNIQHYQDTADYNNGKHYTSIPTPVAIGIKPSYDDMGNPKPMYLGGTKFQFFPNEENISGADVKFLEFSGAGMKTLAEGIQHIESQMSILGAHIIAAEKKGVETAEALRIHRIGENGVLAAFTRNISDQITKALRLKGKWDGENEELLNEWSINFNTDYDLSEENTQTLQVLLTGRASGEIPRMSLYLGLKALNLIPEQWDFDAFLEELENDKNVLPEMDLTGILPENKEPENMEENEDDNEGIREDPETVEKANKRKNRKALKEKEEETNE